MSKTNALTADQEAAADAVTSALRDADTTIRAAIRSAAGAGVSANEIARRTDAKLTGVRGYSRPIVLEILGADDIRNRATIALEVAGFVLGDRYDDDTDFEVWEGAVRSVWIRMAERHRDAAVSTRWNLSGGALDALKDAGMGASLGGSTLNMQQVVGDGDTAEIFEL